MRIVKLCFFLLPSAISAQFITNPKAVPHTGHPPVVFLNGYELDCGSASFQNVFGIADQVLQANGRASLFFNNCAFQGSPSIEKLGAYFGTFLASLTYSDGQPVPSVDVVGYSMGGLIVRSYLTGKQEALGVFSPPLSLPIGKIVFIATPNFGSPVGALAFGTSVEADELSSGSHFLMDLNTWNQNRDDLRGLDAIALAGTGGTGLAVAPGFDDGLMAITSASLRFYMPGRTRVLPLRHVNTPGLLTQTGFCPPNAKGIARINSASDDNARIIVSFLNGTGEWQSIGGTVDQSGIMIRARTANDTAVNPGSITAGKKLNMSNSEIAWSDLVTTGSTNISVSAGAQSFAQTVDIPSGGSQAFVLKPGPDIAAVIPAAAAVFPRVVAPRMLVAIYGSSLDQATVTVNGSTASILYSSAGQINAVLPADVVPGLSKLAIQNAAGSQSMNLWFEPAFPAVFTLDQSGIGPAAAVNFTNGKVVSQTNPMHAGEYLEIYLTGLGITGQAQVSVAGVDCPVSYAGPAPTFQGLDQINCRMPGGLGVQAAAPLVVTANGRSWPGATIAVQ